MSRERLNEEIKTRVPTEVKIAFDRLAEERHLSQAAVVREAMREYLERVGDPQLDLSLNGKRTKTEAAA